jgi:pimeloyl-ACP methyl ester carboxylesterase
MGIVQASLVGHALGATVALRFSILYPDRVYRLATVSLPVTPTSISGRLLDFASNSPLAKMLWWRQIPHKEVQQEAEKMAEGNQKKLTLIVLSGDLDKLFAAFSIAGGAAAAAFEVVMFFTG